MKSFWWEIGERDVKLLSEEYGLTDEKEFNDVVE